jgi:hypothetical protein
VGTGEIISHSDDITAEEALQRFRAAQERPAGA